MWIAKHNFLDLLCTQLTGSDTAKEDLVIDERAGKSDAY